MIYDIRQPYESNLYVGREREWELAQNWWASDKRLLTITAPPATGKTWFLRKVEEEFDRQKVVSFWLDVKELMLSSIDKITRSRKLNPERVNDWLKKFVLEINQRCSGKLEEFTLSDNPKDTIEQLAKAMCELCLSGESICIFIDDGDQIDDEGWREFERWFLEPFAQQKPLRFIIAIREKRSVLTYAIRLSERRIELATLIPNDRAHPGAQQLKRLVQQRYPTISEVIEEFLTSFQDLGYDQTHPGLNTFLCLFAKENPDLPFDKRFLSTALEAVNPLSKEDIEYIIVLLQGIVMLEDEWDIEKLAKAFQIPRSIAWDYVQVLEDNALVTRPSLNRFKIVDGVRGFVQAVIRKEISLAMAGIRTDSHRPTLHYKIHARFSLDELIQICFNLNIQHDDALVGQQTLNKIITLIEYCEHRNRLSDLLAECRRLRPNFDWS